MDGEPGNWGAKKHGREGPNGGTMTWRKEGSRSQAEEGHVSRCIDGARKVRGPCREMDDLGEEEEIVPNDDSGGQQYDAEGRGSTTAAHVRMRGLTSL